MSGCPACAGYDVDPLHAAIAWTPYRVVRCRQCGLARTDPQADPVALLVAYQARSVPRHRLATLSARARARFAAAFAARAMRGLGGADGRVLDVGCGDGAVLAALAARGLVAVGTELPGRGFPAPPGVALAHTDDIADLRLPEASCRLVILRHALEHLRDPSATLREARRILGPAGRLIVAVPNLASWQARCAGAAWVHLDVPRHLFHFTPATLLPLIRAAGFTIERTAQLSLEHGPYGWLRAVFDEPTPRRPWALAAATAALPLCILLSLAEALAGRGAVIEVWARPAVAARRSGSANVP